MTSARPDVKRSLLTFAVLALAAACGTADLEVNEADELGMTEEELQIQQCIALLSADGGSNVGSPGFAKALSDCIKGAVADAGLAPPSFDAGASPPPAVDASVPQVCTVNLLCTNGACECASGSNAGQACQPADCITTCQVCN